MSRPSHSGILQRRQREGEQHDGRVQAHPHRDGGLGLRRRRRLVARARRRRTSCRRSCRWSASGSRRTSRPRREVPGAPWRSATCRGRPRSRSGRAPSTRLERPRRAGTARCRGSPSNLLSARRSRSCQARKSSTFSGLTRWVTTTVTSGSVGRAPPPMTCWVPGPSKYCLPAVESFLPGGAVDPGLHVGDRVEAVHHHPVGLHRGRRVDLGAEESRVLRRHRAFMSCCQASKACSEPARTRCPMMTGGGGVGGLLGVHGLFSRAHAVAISRPGRVGCRCARGSAGSSR